MTTTHGAHVHSKGRRDYKGFSTGEYYHIFNRGNAKSDIFLEDADYQLFLNRLSEALFPNPAHGHHVQRGRGVRKQLPPDSFSLIAYCLMPNHYHLLVRQNSELPVGALVLKVCGGYAKVFNKKYHRVGSLFQDQFKAVHVDRNEYLLHLSAYIHQNPKVAGLVSDMGAWEYSSYPEYVRQVEWEVCDKKIILDQFQGPDAYSVFANESFEFIKKNKEAERYLMDYEL